MNFKIENIILILVLIFFTILNVSFALHPSPLADDIGTYYRFLQFHNNETTIQDVFSYSSDTNRYSRPVSILSIVFFNFISKPSIQLFFLWGLVFIVYILLLNKILKKYFPNAKWFAVIACIFVLIYPLSSSNVFSPMMQSIQVIIGLFLYSILLCSKKENKYHILIGILLSASLLLYEQNIFIFPIIALLILHHHKKTCHLKLFYALVIPIIILFIYRIFIGKLIFTNYFDYGSSKIDFSIIKSVELLYSFTKLFTIDYFYVLYKSILQIELYSLVDFILLFMSILISAFIFKNIKVKHKITRAKFLILLGFFILTTVLFFISQYPPVAFGFENRILLWIRFSSSILFAALFYQALFFSKGIMYRIVKCVLFFVLLFNFIALISQKNSWIEAARYNKKMVQKIDKLVPYDQENARILIVTNTKQKEKFITDESVASVDYELDAAFKLYTTSKLKGENIGFFNPKDYSLYNLFGRPINNRYKTKYSIDDEGIEIGDTNLSFPFYVFDERKNNIVKVNNKLEFNIE